MRSCVMKIFRWVWLAVTLGLLGYAFYQGMYVAPTEATMGDIQRIFYYHFPSAMMTFLFFFIIFLASICYLRSGSGNVACGVLEFGSMAGVGASAGRLAVQR